MIPGSSEKRNNWDRVPQRIRLFYVSDLEKKYDKFQVFSYKKVVKDDGTKDGKKESIQTELHKVLSEQFIWL